MILFLFFSYYLSAEVLFERKKDSEKPKTSNEKTIEERVKRAIHKRKPASKRGNLPSFYSRSYNTISLNIQTPKNPNKSESSTFRNGQIYEVELLSDLYIYEGTENPIMAIYKKGQKIITLEGFATLNPDKTSADIIFKSFHIDNDTFSFLAKAGSNSDIKTVKASFNSKEKGYFLADALSVATAAYFDSRVKRRVSVFGNSVEENTVDNALKKGVAAGFLESSNRFKEKIQNERPYGLVPASQKLTILILKKGVGI